MKKKRFLALLSLGALAAACALSLAACDSGTATVEYTLSEDGTHYIVSGVKGSKRALTSYDILSEYAEEGGTSLPVTEIGYEAFMSCKSLYSVTIPDSITTISMRAFMDCPFSQITIPHSVTTIGYAAFGMCSMLTEIVIPSSVTSIAPYAFAYCSKVETIVIEEGIKELNAYVFANSYAVSAGQVYTNTSLETIYIPASVTRIYHNALQGNTLTTINYGGSEEQWSDLYFYNLEKADDEENPHEVKIKKDEIIPDTVTVKYGVHYQPQEQQEQDK